MVMHDNELKQKKGEIKFKSRIKLNHNMYVCNAVCEQLNRLQINVSLNYSNKLLAEFLAPNTSVESSLQVLVALLTTERKLVSSQMHDIRV